MEFNPSELLRDARSKAGLSQRELAKRAGTSQSVIARIESGTNSPAVSTLKNLLEAAGFELHTQLVVKPVESSHMLDDVDRILALSPEERLRELANIDHLLKAAQNV